VNSTSDRFSLRANLVFGSDRDGAGFTEGWEVSTIGHVDNSTGQSDRLTMAIAPTVRLGSFDTFPVASTRHGGGERGGRGAR
jgi:hypothetical protein